MSAATKRSEPDFECLTLSLRRKQNQLWLDGLEYYRGTGSNKAPPCPYGIYSIRQRDLHKTAAVPAIKTVSTSQSYDEINDNETNSKSMKLKERVRKISQKVDSIKLNDSKSTAIGGRNQPQRDENKNTVKPVTIKSSTITTSKVIYPSISLNIDNNQNASNDNNNNHNNLNNNNKHEMCISKLGKNCAPTQGDTLNQIKAMRRQRQSRLSTNSSYAIGS